MHQKSVRKCRNLLVAALAVIGLAGGAEAKSLEEILMDKGVITEEDFKQATEKSDLAYYKPGRGITVQTRDRNYLAHVGGRLQARYSFEDLDQDKDVSSFEIRRMKVWLRGHIVTPNLTYKYQQNKNETEDAYAAYKFMDAFALQVGQAKAPQGAQELTSSGSQLFVDRSLANERYNLGRDIGVTAEGAFADSMVEYMLGIYNGNGPGENANNQHMLAGRIDINPLGKYKKDEAGWPTDKPLLNLGASYAMETMKQGEDIDTDNAILDDFLGELGFAFGDEVDWDVWTLNLLAKWMGATFGAEYYNASAEPDSGSDFDGDGFYVQAGYQVIPKTLELAVRYSEATSDDDYAKDQDIAFDESAFQVGINYYLSKHNAKLQADYTAASDDIGDVDDNIFRVQAQVIF